MTEQPPDPRFRNRVQESFARQGLMDLIGARLLKVEAGAVDIVLEPRPEISQQHGFVHGGAVAAIGDSAAGYSALTLMPPGTGVLSTEFKINFVSPARGDLIIARGRVIKAGRLLTLAQSDVVAHSGGTEKLVALLTVTLMAIENREGVAD